MHAKARKTLPRLGRVLAADAARLAAEAFREAAAQPGAAPVASDLRRAAEVVVLAAAGRLSAGGNAPSPRPPPTLSGGVIVDEGLRPLLGEVAYLALESGRPADAARLFGALAALAPEQAGAYVGLATVWLALHHPAAAVEAARRAVAAEADAPEAHAALAEALVFAGRPLEARAVVARVRRATGPAASWLRLLRVGLDEGWLAELTA